MATPRLRLTLLGVGAMNSPRFAPAGLLVRCGDAAIAIDGGPGAEPPQDVVAWLVTDEHAELRAALRRLAGARGMPSPAVAEYSSGSLSVRPFPVEHTSHAAYGYRIGARCRTAVWAPEFWRFPDWADGADLMFAEAAGWDRPIRFRGGVGGHASVAQVAAEAARRGVRRLVYAHIGWPSLRAMDAGLQPRFGEWGAEGRTYTIAAYPGPDPAVSATPRVTRLALPGCAGVHGAGDCAENAPQDIAGRFVVSRSRVCAYNEQLGPGAGPGQHLCGLAPLNAAADRNGQTFGVLLCDHPFQHGAGFGLRARAGVVRDGVHDLQGGVAQPCLGDGPAERGERAR